MEEKKEKVRAGKDEKSEGWMEEWERVQAMDKMTRWWGLKKGNLRIVLDEQRWREKSFIALDWRKENAYIFCTNIYVYALSLHTNPSNQPQFLSYSKWVMDFLIRVLWASYYQDPQFHLLLSCSTYFHQVTKKKSNCYYYVLTAENLASSRNTN